MSAFGTSSRDGGSDGWYEDAGRDPYARDTRPYRRQPRAAKPSPKRRGGRRWPRRLGKTLLVLIILLAVVGGGLWVFTPSVSNAPALVQEQAVSHGISYPGVQPPARFTQALVATEDKRFYTNVGVDPLAVARLAWGNVTGHPDQGGSTLEQQLAKNLYTNGRSGFLVETEQVVLAVKLNLHYTKAQILQMYAEIAYYGNNYYGLQQASCGYFGVQPAELSWPEAALLAGVVNAPTADDPRTNPQNARNRETHVVDRLVAVGTLNQAQAKLVLAENLNLVPEGTGCR